ncbi:MAG: hypothetical protein C0509_06155 [Acinetobacter sp.]|nr:hypothetical protein [Acinetobacter sp.]
MNLSLKDAAELVGVSKVALLKAIQKGHLKADRGDNQEWLVTAAEATRYRDNRQHKTPTNRKLVSGNLTHDNSQLAVIDEVKDKLIYQLNQRLEEEKLNRAREVELMSQQIRLLTDQSGKMPQEAVEKIARLEADKAAQEKVAADKIAALEVEKAEKAREVEQERITAKRIADELAETKAALQTVKEQAAAISPDELEQLKRKAKVADDQQAFNEMRDKIVAEYNALPYLKRIMTAKPTAQTIRAALRQSRGGEGSSVTTKDTEPTQQEKTA